MSTNRGNGVHRARTTEQSLGALAKSLWLTPNVPNGGRSVPESLVQSKGMTPEGKKRTVSLESQTRYWATPTTNEHTGPGAGPNKTGAPNLRTQTDAWPTPRGTDGTHGGPNQAGSKGDLMLPSAAAQWPTPTASDSGEKVTPNSHQSGLIGAAHTFSHPDQPTLLGDGSSAHRLGLRRHLNPAFGAWLMGWPSTWTIAEPSASSASATVLWRSALQQRLSSFFNDQE